MVLYIIYIPKNIRTDETILKKHEEEVLSESDDGISKIWRTPVTKYNIRDFYVDDTQEESYLPLRLIVAHEEHCFKKYYRRRERSAVFAIELVLAGSIYFIQEGKKYHVMPGEVFLVHLGRNCSYWPEEYCQRLSCTISGKSLQAVVHATGLFECDVVKLKSPESLEKMEKLMRLCMDEYKHKKPQFRIRASELVYRLLMELARINHIQDKPELLEKAVELLEHHLSKTLSLNELAALLGSSRSSLTRIFAQYLNETPINYFIRLKMDAAKSLLQNTSMQIQEIADYIGYSNSLYFSSEFKKRVGKCPREYRKCTRNFEKTS